MTSFDCARSCREPSECSTGIPFSCTISGKEGQQVCKYYFAQLSVVNKCHSGHLHVVAAKEKGFTHFNQVMKLITSVIWRGVGLIIMSLCVVTTVHAKVFKSAVCSKKADLCFVVDSSGSINKADPGNWNRVKAFLKHVISRLQIGKDKTRVAIVLFSNMGRVHLKLNELDSVSAINRRIDSLPYQNGNTNTSGGLYFMNKIIFQPTNGDRPKISNIGIVITDGHSTRDKRLTVPYAQEARDHGVKILAIGITNKINMTELMRIASHPHERTIFNVDDFDKLNNALDNLVGESCVKECKRRADICFIVDSSGSIITDDPHNWDRVKTFLKNVVSRFKIKSDGVRIAVVVFSDRGHVELKLNEEYTNEGIFRRIENLPYFDGNTNTSGGIYLMNHVIFQPGNGDRSGVENIAIVITDGASTMDRHLTVPYAKEAKSKGVKMITIGITKSVNITELKAIASTPHKYTMFHVNDVKTLGDALDNLVGEACFTGINRTTVSQPRPTIPSPVVGTSCTTRRKSTTTTTTAVPRPAPVTVVTQHPVGTTCTLRDMFSCDMEKDASKDKRCRIRQDTTDDFDWRCNSGKTPASLHNNRTINGHQYPVTGPYAARSGVNYLYTEVRSLGVHMIARLILEGDDFHGGGYHCLRLAYCHNGFHMGDLRVYDRVGKGKRKTWWSMAGDYDFNWHTAAVLLDITSVSEIGLQSEVAGYHGDMALDDIGMTPGRCEEIPPGHIWACNFETADGASTMCDLEQDRKTDVFDWTLFHGKTPSKPTGPDSAYNGEYYIYIEASHRKKGDDARIMFPRAGSRQRVRLSFHYNMFGFHIARLEVCIWRNGRYIEDFWSKQGPQGTEWKLAEVTLHIEKNDRIGFRATRGSSYSGDIAIDNISIKPMNNKEEAD